MALNQEQFEKLEAYIDGVLDPAARAEVEKQLLANPQLMKLMGELVTTRELMHGLPRAKAPADLIETFQGQFERAELLGQSGPSESDVVARINRGPQYLVAAAIVLLALGTAGIIYKLVLPHGKPGNTFVIAPTGGTGEQSTGEADVTPSPTRAPGGAGFGGPRKVEGGGARPETSAVAGTTRPSGAIAMDEVRPRVSLEDVRRAQSQLGSATQPLAPAGEPIVMVIRAENPSQASAQVISYLNANNIAFDTAPAANDVEALGQPGTPLADRARSDVSSLRAQAPAENDRPLASATNAPPAQQQAADANKEPAGGQQSDAGIRQQRALAGGQQSQQAFKAQAQGGQQALPPTPSVAVAQNQGQNLSQALAPNATGGHVYRAALTRRQLRDLNTQLQSQGNQWTEFRGLVATDAIEGNGIANLLTAETAEKPAAPLSLPAALPSTPPTTQSSSSAVVPTTLPAFVTPAAPAVAARPLAGGEFSMRASTTTAPTTNPADRLLADREELREVVIVVNDQPIDGGGANAAGLPASTTQRSGPATQPVPVPTTGPAGR